MPDHGPDPLLLDRGWRVRPSAFDLIESGGLSDDEPRFGDFPAALPSSRFVPLSRREVGELWRSLLRRLRGYVTSRQVTEPQTIWLPIIDLPAPPSGRSILEFRTAGSRRVTPCLKVFGVGLGAKAEHSFSESFQIEASGVGKQYLVSLDLTAREWLSKTDPPIRTIDLSIPAKGVNERVVDLPTDADDPAVTGVWDPDQWIETKRVELSHATGLGMETRRLAVARTCSWKPGFHLPPVAGIAGLDLGLEVEVERSDSFELSFELPYGQDYIFYRRSSEIPLVPRCSVAGQW